MKDKILQAGVDLWPDVTLSTVARSLGITPAGVLHHFPSDGLKDAVAHHAVETGNSRVIVQLVALGHHSIAEMSQAERLRHFKRI